MEQIYYFWSAKDTNKFTCSIGALDEELKTSAKKKKKKKKCKEDNIQNEFNIST